MDPVRKNQLRILGNDHSLPRILIGGMNDSHFPNFHTNALLKAATVVSVTSNAQEALRPDRLYVQPSEPISQALKRCPIQDFDFFWDNMVLGKHRIPVGLCSLPFPLIVGVIHVYKAKPLNQLFDHVLSDSPGVARRYGYTRFPAGLNFGTQNERMSLTIGQKDVDVSFTMSDQVPCARIRTKAYKEIQRIGAKHPEWKIVTAFNLPYQEYCALLARSKISIHVGDWAAPMTYRALEILEAEAFLLSADESDPFKTSLSDTLPKGDVYESFRVRQLESSISALLSNPENTRLRAQKAKIWIHEHLSYEKQYQRLIDFGMQAEKNGSLKGVEWERACCSALWDADASSVGLASEHTQGAFADPDTRRLNFNLAMFVPAACRSMFPPQVIQGYKLQNTPFQDMSFMSYYGAPDPLINWAGLMARRETGQATMQEKDMILKAFGQGIPEVPEPNLFHMTWKGFRQARASFHKKLAWAANDQEKRQEAYQWAIRKTLES